MHFLKQTKKLLTLLLLCTLPNIYCSTSESDSSSDDFWGPKQTNKEDLKQDPLYKLLEKKGEKNQVVNFPENKYVNYNHFYRKDFQKENFDIDWFSEARLVNGYNFSYKRLFEKNKKYNSISKKSFQVQVRLLHHDKLDQIIQGLFSLHCHKIDFRTADQITPLIHNYVTNDKIKKIKDFYPFYLTLHTQGASLQFFLNKKAVQLYKETYFSSNVMDMCTNFFGLLMKQPLDTFCQQKKITANTYYLLPLRDSYEVNINSSLVNVIDSISPFHNEDEKKSFQTYYITDPSDFNQKLGYCCLLSNMEKFDSNQTKKTSCLKEVQQVLDKEYKKYGDCSLTEWLPMISNPEVCHVAIFLLGSMGIYDL